MGDIWTIRSAFEWTESYLERKGDENPRLSTQWLLSEATRLSRVDLYAHFDKPLSMAERDVLRDIVSRRGNGEPLQYITGEVGFRHLTLKVRSGVLIPRPETEVLVSEALALLPHVRREGTWNGEAVEDGTEAESDSETIADQPDVLIADVCTGSGCIACSIAQEYPRAQVLASDIDAGALALAKENAETCGLADKITFYQGDLGAAIPDEFKGKIDLIVSNPPYIPTAVLSQIPREVSEFEPNLALDGGADGLDQFRVLAPWAFQMLSDKGAFVVELFEGHITQAAALAKEVGFTSTRIVCDLAGRKRVLVAHALR